MPEWVGHAQTLVKHDNLFQSVAGTSSFSPVDSLAVENVKTWRENNEENDHDGSEDEGFGYEGDVFQVSVDKCAGHG